MYRKITTPLMITLLTAMLTSCLLLAPSPDTDTAPSDTEVIHDCMETALPVTENTDAAEAVARIQANVISTVNEKLDIILADSDGYTSAREYISAHPEEFAAIVALGEDAIPYLDNESTGIKSYDSSPENIRRIIAMEAKYAIKPELYDLVYPSPDGKTELKLSPCSFDTLTDPFDGINYTVYITDCETGKSLIPEGEEVLAMGNYRQVIWSPDSKYAAVTRDHRHDFADIIVFDIANSNYIYVSEYYNVYATAHNKELSVFDSESGITYDRLHCLFRSWGENSLTFTAILCSANGDRILIDELTIDLAAESATE